MDGKSIFSQQLYQRLGSASAPVLVDVRREDAFGIDQAIIIGAIRRSPETVTRWQSVLPKGGDVVIHCVHSDEVSQGVGGDVRNNDAAKSLHAGATTVAPHFEARNAQARSPWSGGRSMAAGQ